MHKIIEAVAQKMRLPYWWIEAVAIEYTECREYATRDEIWTFNFGKLSESDLEKAVRSNHVLIQGTLMHNVNLDVWRSRTLERIVSDIPVALCEQLDDVIAEGLVSDCHFLFTTNPIDVWDPKLDFSRHFQVLENGQFWQWHIADFVRVEGRSYGKWISSEVDLEPLDQIHEKLTLLRNPVIKPGESGHADFKVKVEKFYQWLNDLRRPILTALWDVHVRKRHAVSSFPKVTNCTPPRLSRFESFTVRDGEIYTKFFAAPVFFRSCCQHVNEAEKLVSSSDEQGRIAELDVIYQERVTAILLCAACLEAFINDLGFRHFPQLWKNIERMSLTAKWQLFLVLKGKDDLFDPSREPYQWLERLRKCRNIMMHYKGNYKRIRQIRNTVVTHTESELSRKFICDMPKRLEQLIRELCESTALSIPTWLTLKQT